MTPGSCAAAYRSFSRSAATMPAWNSAGEMSAHMSSRTEWKTHSAELFVRLPGELAVVERFLSKGSGAEKFQCL